MTYGVVYGLRDPLTGKLRYVGQTVLPLHRRLAAHCTPSSLSQVDHRANWIKSLVNQGLRPEIEGLASARSKEDLDELEIQVIAQARALGEKLTNLEPGGGTLSPEHYQRLGSQKRNVPRTPEVKAKISAAKKGKPSHMEGKTHSEEVKKGFLQNPLYSRPTCLKSSIFNRIKKAGYVWDRYSKKLMPLHCSRGQS